MSSFKAGSLIIMRMRKVLGKHISRQIFPKPSHNVLLCPVQSLLKSYLGHPSLANTHLWVFGIFLNIPLAPSFPNLLHQLVTIT